MQGSKRPYGMQIIKVLNYSDAVMQAPDSGTKRYECTPVASSVHVMIAEQGKSHAKSRQHERLHTNTNYENYKILLAMAIHPCHYPGHIGAEPSLVIAAMAYQGKKRSKRNGWSNSDGSACQMPLLARQRSVLPASLQ